MAMMVLPVCPYSLCTRQALACMAFGGVEELHAGVRGTRAPGARAGVRSTHSTYHTARCTAQLVIGDITYVYIVFTRLGEYIILLFPTSDARKCLLLHPSRFRGCFLGGFLHLGPGMSTQQSRVDHVTRSEPDDKKIETSPFKSYNLKKQYKTIKIISTSTQAIQIFKKK